MKKTISIIVVCIALSMLLLTSVKAASFSDTAGYPWENSIEYLKNKGIVQGYSDGSFHPDERVNRAEFTKIIMQSNFEEELQNFIPSQKCFEDVELYQWFAPYICLAAEKKIINGYPDGNFQPSQTINQAEALKILLGTFEIPLTAKEGEWFETYLETANKIGMFYFAPNNPALYELTRGEMAYFTAWLLSQQENIFVDQMGKPKADPFTYTVSGGIHVVKMQARAVKMRVMTGNESIRLQNPNKCDFPSGNCAGESQAESFASFVNRSHKNLVINGSFFDAYSLPLDGVNFHTVGSDLVMYGEQKFTFGGNMAFGNGGMLAQLIDGSFKIYFPARNWLEEADNIFFGLSNYPMVLDAGHVRNAEEIGQSAENDAKFWVRSRRGGLGISADRQNVYYVSVVGTVEDLGNALKANGADHGFALDAGGTNAFYLNGKTIFSPGRNLTNVIEFYVE